MNYTYATQQEIDTARETNPLLDDPMYCIAHGIRQPNDLMLGCHVVMLDRGFVYVGNMSFKYDEAGEPWLVITSAKNITQFAVKKGLGTLRHGPRDGTVTSEWDVIIAPYKDIMFMIRADYAAWGLPEQDAPAGYGNAYHMLNKHTAEEYAACPGIRNHADMDCKITIADRGFVFAGKTHMAYDNQNRPWVFITNSRNFADYGDVQIGALRTGPAPGTKHDGWGDVAIPFHALAHFVLADASAWDTTDPTIEYLQAD